MRAERSPSSDADDRLGVGFEGGGKLFTRESELVSVQDWVCGERCCLGIS